MGKPSNPVEAHRKQEKKKIQKKQKEQRQAAKEAKDAPKPEEEAKKPQVKVTLELEIAGKRRKIEQGTQEKPTTVLFDPLKNLRDDKDKDLELQDLDDLPSREDVEIENLEELESSQEESEVDFVEIDLDELMEDAIVVEYGDLNYIPFPKDGEARRSTFFNRLELSEVRHVEKVVPPPQEKPKEKHVEKKNHAKSERRPRPPPIPPANLALPPKPVVPSALSTNIPAHAVISAEPVMRDLQKELTSLVPNVVRKKVEMVVKLQPEVIKEPDEEQEASD